MEKRRVITLHHRRKRDECAHHDDLDAPEGAVLSPDRPQPCIDGVDQIDADHGNLVDDEALHAPVENPLRSFGRAFASRRRGGSLKNEWMVCACAFSAAMAVGAATACLSPPGRSRRERTSLVFPVPARPTTSTTGAPASIAARASPTPGDRSYVSSR